MLSTQSVFNVTPPDQRALRCGEWNPRCRWHDPFGSTSYRVSGSEESGEQSDVTEAAEDFHTDH